MKYKKIACASLILILALTLGSVLTAMPAAAASTYYVSTTGDDTTGEGTFANPWATITHALDQASSGDTINVAAGTYTDDIWDSSLGIPGGYRVTKSVTLLGAQAGNDPDGSTDRGGETILVKTNGVPYSLYNSNITIDGFTFTSGGGSGGGRIIVSEFGDGTIIRNCIIKDIHGTDPHGIYVYSGAENVLIEHNTFSNTTWEAISSHGGAEITGNTISGTGAYGIFVASGADGSLISGNVISGTPYEAVRVEAPVTLSGNQITGGYYGIFLYTGSGGSTLSGNTVSNSTYEVINATEQVTITNNTVTGGYGIQLIDNAAGSLVDGNTVSSSSAIDIKSWVQADITNNTVSGGWGGIELLSGATGSSIVGNTVSGTAAESLRIWAEDATITDNDLSGGYSGIGLWANGAMINCNQIYENQYWGVSIDSGVNNAVIYCNQLSDNPYCGVIVWGSGEGSGFNIHFNNITGNGIFGVESQRDVSSADATNNWWGDPSGPGGVGPGSGDPVSTYVLFDPWLTVEVSECETMSISGSGSFQNTATGGDVTIEADGDHTITIAKYAGNPAGPPTFQATGNFYDVNLDDFTGVESLTIEFCQDITPETIIYFWDVTTSRWLPCSNQSYSGGCILVTVTVDTFPSLSDLTGCVFASGIEYPPADTVLIGIEVYPVNKLALVAPWLGLTALLVIATATGLVLQRRKLGRERE